MRLIATLAAMGISASLPLSVVGCTRDIEPQAVPESPTSNDLIHELSYEWSAEPDIDLAVGPAVPIRAYVESFRSGQRTGDIGQLYPGFQRAVASNGPDGGPPDTLGLWPDTEYPVRTVRVGTSRQHILRLTANGSEVTAVVCSYDFGTAAKVSDEKFAFNPSARGAASENAGISTMRITLTQPEGGLPAHLPPQTGPAAQPARDVFGDWKITGKLADLGRASRGRAIWQTYDADESQCVAKAPDTSERRAFLTSGEHPRDDFPTAPPKPGWPESE